MSSFNLEFRDAINAYLYNLNVYGSVTNVSTSLVASADRPTIIVKFFLMFTNDVNSAEKLVTLE